MKDKIKLIVAVTVPLLAGVIGSIFTRPNIAVWYENLAKPVLAPPNWIFGPVWAILFILIGVALFLVWREGWDRNDVKIAIIFFAIQLVLNVLWSVIFFGLQDPASAFIEIVFLWIAIVVTMVAFLEVSKIATWLLLPYLLWVSFATYLNYMIWVLNY